MSIHERARAHALRLLNNGPGTETLLNEVFEFLAHYRCHLLGNTIVSKGGPVVSGGPFAGMKLVQPATGFFAPMLLGCYEEELHGIVRAIPDAGYEHVINIGCGDGYYAVGIKRLAPSVEIWAHDIDPQQQERCRAMAALNGVDIHVGGAFEPERFATHADRRTLIWCDIEGAEEELLDPVRWPALVDMDVLVELHPTDHGHTRATVPARFASTHEIEIFQSGGHAPEFPEWLREAGQLNLLLAQFEGRGAPTPWAMMRARSKAGAV
ncbi:class I SAM-dependent methyltransferase [Niveispirillum lacus]|nr:class I SAM-dependent methyltransferase [Niveispirillum lacus]